MKYSDTSDGVNTDVMRGVVMGMKMIMRAHISMILPPLSTIGSRFGLEGRERAEHFVTDGTRQVPFHRMKLLLVCLICLNIMFLLSHKTIVNAHE